MEKEAIYLYPEQIAKDGRFPFTMGQLRTFLLLRKKNGLNKAVRKIGKRLLININLFQQWIENHK